MIIDFLHYVEMNNARQAALQAERAAEMARRQHLELVLADLLAELLAA